MNTPKIVTEQHVFQRIGILGGTFDPIHFGHINTAQATAQWLDLEQLFLLPAHIPPHKSTTGATAEQRSHMVKLVCKEFPLFKFDDRELLKSTPSFTVESLKEIKSEVKNSQIFFVIGMDSLASFTSWHQWQNILELCHLVVNARPNIEFQLGHLKSKHLLSGYYSNNLAEVLTLESGKIIFHQQQEYNISSTEIRKKIYQQNTTISELPKNVLNYIVANQLYKY